MNFSCDGIIGRIAQPRQSPGSFKPGRVLGWRFGESTGRLELLVDSDGDLKFWDTSEVMLTPTANVPFSER